MQMTNIKINGQDLSRWTDCLWHLWMGQHSEGAIGLTYVCVVWSERFTGRHGICVCVEAVGIQSGRWDLFRVWYLLQKRGPNMFSAFFLRTKHQYARHVSTLLTRSVFFWLILFVFLPLVTAHARSTWAPFTSAERTCETQTGPYYMFLEKGEKVNL